MPLHARRPAHVGRVDGPAYRVVADIVTFKVLAADTGGAHSLFEQCSAPGQGMPRFYQRFEDETFWVLEGTYSFRVADQTVDLAPGGSIFVPRRTIHGFTNIGQAPGRLLVQVTPGGIYERCLRELGQPVPPGTSPALPVEPPDFEHIAAIARKYGVEILSVPRM